MNRALVFSQFTSHLALVREELDRQQIPYFYLDGATPTATRNRLIPNGKLPQAAIPFL